MIVVIAIAVIWGMYKIGNSIGFRDNGEAVAKEHNSIINFIKNTENSEDRKKQIEINLQYNKISLSEANELY